MELIKQLGITVQKEEDIPEIHKNTVRERIKKDNHNPENIQDWEEIRNNFKLQLMSFKIKIGAAAIDDIQEGID